MSNIHKAVCVNQLTWVWGPHFCRWIPLFAQSKQTSSWCKGFASSRAGEDLCRTCIRKQVFTAHQKQLLKCKASGTILLWSSNLPNIQYTPLSMWSNIVHTPSTEITATPQEVLTLHSQKGCSIMFHHVYNFLFTLQSSLLLRLSRASYMYIHVQYNSLC